MASLSSLLPKPRQSLSSAPQSAPQLEKQIQKIVTKSSQSKIPPYGQRKNFKPRAPEDFGNGGAFPEIHMAQYPLDMGRKDKRAVDRKGGALTLEVDSEGQVKYDAIARQGHSEDRIVHTSFKDMVPLKDRKDVDVDKLVMDRPSEEEVQSVAEKTKAALEKIVNSKIQSLKPKNIGPANGNGTNKDPTYIRYTPANTGSGFNSGAKQRIIRMVDAPVDPMEPPSHLHKKVPRGPPSPPAPVMHSPPRKLTAKEQAEWVIPPCVSNWKNTKGYTIPLDKRLAADGRGLQELTINNNFAKFSEALYAADRHAREEVRQRNLMQQKLAQKQKEAEEDKLRQLAQKAREERAGFKPSTSSKAADDAPATSNRPTASSLMVDYDSSDESASEKSESEDEESIKNSSEDESDEEGARARDKLRRERQKQREREMRMSKMGTEARARHLAREQGRDISEKIALGLAKPSLSKDSMFDARLFNQSEGIGSGFKDDDAYNTYDKPLFNQSSSSIYRFRGENTESEVLGSTNVEDLERSIQQDKFGMRKGFQGAEGGASSSAGPVEFEKEMLTTTSSSKAADKDVFGLDTFLNKAKQGKRGRDSDNDDNDRRKR
ncbi:SKIP/SNW domain-containing protein [Mycotypha africana]|uniref:SKIP/SNW domain-containing protein n=1 Tax=Mycotypha africana TaxID=64632 RepID=UPI0022FFD680|nr:SKIP/SNW domain-containing protein [Mycotypha africana]KAI8975571.1 SKIP/SNW domain-containing protein [Mycotypha africana]